MNAPNPIENGRERKFNLFLNGNNYVLIFSCLNNTLNINCSCFE